MSFDTFDALRAGEPTAAEVLGRTHSRLLEWADPAEALLGSDLASAWQQPDPQTLVLTLVPGARWHGRPPLAGRELTLEDVRAHFQRLLDDRTAGRLSPALTRDFATLESVSAGPDGALLLRTARPDPFLLNALAGRFAVVQAPEAVEAFAGAWHELEAATVAGSGPFALVDTGGGARLEFEAHPSGHRRPLLDRLVVVQPPGDGPAARQRFLDGELDIFLARDRRDAAALRQADTVESVRFEDAMTVTTLFAGAPPWDNPELLLALSGALNRLELARRLHGGSARPAGPVAPAFAGFALSGDDLAAYPGYSADAANDAREARARWEAAGGPALGPVTFDFPSIYDPLYSASSVVTGMLNEALGGQFRPAIETYTTISAKAAERRYGSGAAAAWFGWAPPIDAPDPSRYLVTNFRSGSPAGEAFGARIPALDSTLDALALAFSFEERRRLVREASRQLLAAGGGGVLPWLQQQAAVFRQPRFSALPETPFFRHHLDHASFLEPAG